MVKILYGYPSNEGYNNRKGLTEQRLLHIDRLAQAGFEVKPFCMNFTPELPVLTFVQMDKLWRLKNKHLIALYNRFLEAVEDCHAFYNSVGVNFHPEFIEAIPQYTVFGCNDDPESSDLLSKPVAASYNMCAVGNIAEIETYKSWGVKNVVWQPMGFSPTMFDANLTYEKILQGERDIDLSMVIDKLSRYRRHRMEIIDQAFPNAHFYGRGWQRGYLPQGQEVPLMQKTKIGINIHNSTGPINTRLYYLPANGVLQICDNKHHLAQVYKLNEEVIGFDNVEECIELCNYYLLHDEERRQIAAQGWKRALADYNEVAVFNRLVENIEANIIPDNINTEPLATLHCTNRIKSSASGLVYKYWLLKQNSRKRLSKMYHKMRSRLR